jgi:peroxiredoxin
MRTAFFISAFTSTALFGSIFANAQSTPRKEGDAVPDVTLTTRVRIETEDDNPFDWLERTSDDYFGNKRVVLFALPGAFTPTCSTTHLPGYQDNYEDILALGIDEVYCLSVNDAFVMRQWGLFQG